MMMRPAECVYPGCQCTRRTRGLCHNHYQNLRRLIRDGKVTETDVVKRRLLMPPGTGGATVNGHEAFTDPLSLIHI